DIQAASRLDGRSRPRRLCAGHRQRPDRVRPCGCARRGPACACGGRRVRPRAEGRAPTFRARLFGAKCRAHHPPLHGGRAALLERPEPLPVGIRRGRARAGRTGRHVVSWSDELCISRAGPRGGALQHPGASRGLHRRLHHRLAAPGWPGVADHRAPPDRAV
ncbi:MAG: hypothetical protein AVDCRST_MAG68-5279, partial [uncultured Gemmatimonadetes bacterium]